ncbi:MAG: DUF4870 domain-containing protein [Anaerolineae bacterium]
MEAAMEGPNLGQAKEVSSTDDRIWAALAHASAFLMFVGPLVALIMWVMNRRKSPYVAFQSLQVMLYQTIFFWAWFSIIPLVMIILLFVWIALTAPLMSRNANPAALMAVPEFDMMAVMFGSFLVYGLIGVAGAVACLMGRDFKYPWLGQRTAAYLGYEGPATASLDENKEDRIVAAACHSTAMVVFFGILTPITAWLTQHERSRFLRFQAMQTVFYQAIGLIGYFGLVALSMLLMTAMVGGLFAMNSFGFTSHSPGWLIALVLPFTALLCIIELAIPLYHLFAFLGTVRVLRGHNFHYPILGNILASRMQPAEEK